MESYVERWAREQKEKAERERQAEVKEHDQNAGSKGQAEKKIKGGRKPTGMVEESDNK